MKQQPREDFELSMNDIIETAGERTYRVQKQQARVSSKRETMTKERKHFLFINPGSEKINLLKFALKNETPLPKWCQQGTFAKSFALKDKKLLFEGMVVLTNKREPLSRNHISIRKNPVP